MVIVGGQLLSGKYSNEVFTFDLENHDWGILPLKYEASPFAQGAGCSVLKPNKLTIGSSSKEEEITRIVSTLMI